MSPGCDDGLTVTIVVRKRDAVMELLHEHVTGQLIGAYYTVYNRLGSTYPEHILESAMMLVLRRAGVECVRQDEHRIIYKDRLVGVQRLDILAAEKVVAEIKVTDRIEPIHLAQLLSYVKTVGGEVGLLFRFGGPQPEFARRVLTAQAWQQMETAPATDYLDQAKLLFPELTGEVLDALLEVWRTLGPGFIHRIYANASMHEMRLRGMDVLPRREFSVFFDDANLGSIKFGHLQIDNRALVFPTAIASMEQLRISNLKAWMRHLGIPLGIVVNFRSTRFEPLILRL
jgi:GxxExxY protein